MVLEAPAGRWGSPQAIAPHEGASAVAFYIRSPEEGVEGVLCYVSSRGGAVIEQFQRVAVAEAPVGPISICVRATEEATTVEVGVNELYEEQPG